jgi:hypothetical protein
MFMADFAKPLLPAGRFISRKFKTTKMQDLLNTENLVELHEKLNEFAKYHHNKGGQEARQTINKVLIDNLKDNPRDGSPECKLRDEGYDKALKDVLSLLHRVFVP